MRYIHEFLFWFNEFAGVLIFRLYYWTSLGLFQAWASWHLRTATAQGLRGKILIVNPRSKEKGQPMLIMRPKK